MTKIHLMTGNPDVDICDGKEMNLFIIHQFETADARLPIQRLLVRIPSGESVRPH